MFVERIDLLTWLEGASDESEYIKPFEGDSGAGEAKAAAAAVPTVSGTGVGVTQQSASGKPVKVIDARLQEIYNGERKMGDRIHSFTRNKTNGIQRTTTPYCQLTDTFTGLLPRS